MVRADEENQRKEGHEFYKMDTKSILSIREVLSYNFLSLAREQLAVVRRLVKQLDDDQLDTNSTLNDTNESRDGKRCLGEWWQLI